MMKIKNADIRRVLCAIIVFLAIALCISQVESFAGNKEVMVYSQSDITTALNQARAGDSIKLVLCNNILLGKDLSEEIVVKKDVAVTLSNADGQKAVVTRNFFNSDKGKTSRFNVQGSLTIEENNVGGGSLTFDGASIDYSKNPIFAVSEEGSSLTINSGSFIEQSSSYGMAYSADGATTTINGGQYFQNSNIDKMNLRQGGVIWAANSNLIINGGTFSENTAGLIGGAIYYEGRTKDNKLLINGGIFYKNSAGGVFGGGAVFIDCAKGDEDGTTYYSLAEINGGQFLENYTPIGFGGAIYIQVGAEVKMGKAYIHDNTAGNDGGGVWNCPTGGGDYYTFHGLYLAENTAGSEGDDFYSAVEEGVAKPNVYLTDYAFTGDKINWVLDEDNEDNEDKGEAAESDYYQNSDKIIALKSGLAENKALDDSDIAVFFGNNAQSGGAIANNGNLQAGEETKLYLMKKITTETNELFSFTVSLTREERGINGSFL